MDKIHKNNCYGAAGDALKVYYPSTRRAFKIE